MNPPRGASWRLRGASVAERSPPLSTSYRCVDRAACRAMLAETRRRQRTMLRKNMLAGLGLAGLGAHGAMAQRSRSARFVVQAPPGGAIDVIARLNAQRDRPALSAAAGGAWPGLGGGEPCGGQQHHRRRRDRPRRAGWPQFSGEIRHPPDGRARGASCAIRPTPRPTHVFGTRHPRHDLLGAARCDGGDAPSCPPVLGRGRSVLLARHGVCCVGARLRVAVFTSVKGQSNDAAGQPAARPGELPDARRDGEDRGDAAVGHAARACLGLLADARRLWRD